MNRPQLSVPFPFPVCIERFDQIGFVKETGKCELLYSVAMFIWKRYNKHNRMGKRQ